MREQQAITAPGQNPSEYALSPGSWAVLRQRLELEAGALESPRAKEAALVDLAVREGVHLLWATRSSSEPAELRVLLRARLQMQRLWEAGHHRLLQSALEALSSAGIPFLVFKGSALAYSVYPSPELRPRADTDIWIRPADRQLAVAVLVRQLWAVRGPVADRYASYEVTLAIADMGLTHQIDLHWRMHHSPWICARLDFEAIHKRALQTPKLGPAVRTPEPIDAFLLAAVHAANDLGIPVLTPDGPAHGHRRWIWAYDAVLLLRADASGDGAWVQRIEECRLIEPARELLCEAVKLFGSERAQRILHLLAPATDGTPLSWYHQASRPQRLVADLKALGNHAERLCFIREALAPSAEYLRARFPGLAHRSRWRLALLRLWRGAWRSDSKTPSAPNAHTAA